MASVSCQGGLDLQERRAERKGSVCTNQLKSKQATGKIKPQQKETRVRIHFRVLAHSIGTHTQNQALKIGDRHKNLNLLNFDNKSEIPTFRNRTLWLKKRVMCQVAPVIKVGKTNFPSEMARFTYLCHWYQSYEPSKVSDSGQCHGA